MGRLRKQAGRDEIVDAASCRSMQDGASPQPMTDDIDRLIDRDQLKVLITIVEARSFSAAALALGVSQPSISQQVKRIERMVGRTLFRRTRIGVELTSDGEAVVIYARAMLALTADLKQHLRQTTGTMNISVGMSEDFSRTALPVVLGLFMRSHPNVEMRIISGHYDMLAAAADTRAVDLAVMRRTAHLPNATPLWTAELAWNGSPSLVLPIADPVPLVLPMAPSPMRDVLIETLRAHGRTWRVPFESISLTSLEAALQAGIGVCAGPRSMPLVGVTQFDETSGLPPLPPAEFVMVEPVSTASVAIMAFAEVLREAAISSFARPDAGAWQM